MKLFPTAEDFLKRVRQAIPPGCRLQHSYGTLKGSPANATGAMSC
jgi:hypothetical protein